MEEKNNISFEWIPSLALLQQVRNTNGCFGDYCIVRLLDDRQVILDRRNFKTLALFFDQKYTVPSNGTGWLKRGFLIVELRENSSKYYIIEAKSNKVVVSGSYISNSEEFAKGESDYFIVHDDQQGRAIFDKYGKRISDWFENIYLFEQKGRTTYYQARRDGKWAIFLIDGKQISDWAEEFEKSSGWFVGKSDYFVASRDWGREKAIFRKDGKMISGWCKNGDMTSSWQPWEKVLFFYRYLVNGESDYFMIKHNGKEAIFDKNGEQITDWFDWISAVGLVGGESNYYEARRNEKEAIFDKDGKQITDWFDRIYAYGLLQGSSDYYLVTKDGKQALFYKDGTQSSDWFDEIETDGLADGQSDYYIAKKDGKQAIFHKSGKQISYWFDWINPYGLVEGYSDYYVGSARGGLYAGKLGSTKILGPFKDIEVLDSWDDNGPTFDPSLTTVVYTFDGREIIISEQEAEQFFGEEEDIEHEGEK